MLWPSKAFAGAGPPLFPSHLKRCISPIQMSSAKRGHDGHYLGVEFKYGW